MNILETTKQYLDQIDTSNNSISINLTDSQSEWLIDNLMMFVESSDSNSQVRTNLLKKVILPSLYKLYLPYALIFVGSCVGVGYLIGRK